jgi:hypothetical protein
MEGSILGRKRGNHLLTQLPLLQSSMEEGTILSYEVEWSRSAYQDLEDHICRAILWHFEWGEWWKVLESWRCWQQRVYFDRKMTPNTPTEGQPSGFKVTALILWLGQLNSLTLIPLNTFGWISRILLRSIQYYLKNCTSCGRGWQKSGIKFY